MPETLEKDLKRSMIYDVESTQTEKISRQKQCLSLSDHLGRPLQTFTFHTVLSLFSPIDIQLSQLGLNLGDVSVADVVN